MNSNIIVDVSQSKASNFRCRFNRIAKMVVLAAAILTKSGKPLLSRQFVEMSRIRIEGLLAAFPKLMGTGKQYTYLETDTVRYVYQPIETLFLGVPLRALAPRSPLYLYI